MSPCPLRASTGTTEFLKNCAGASLTSKPKPLSCTPSSDQAHRGDPAYAYNDKLEASGTGNGQFDDPHGLVVDGSGNIFVCDTNNERVQKLDTALDCVSKFGTSGAGDGNFAANNGAWDIAQDASNNLWVVDKGTIVFRSLQFRRLSKLIFVGLGYEYSAKLSASGTGNGQFTDVRGIVALSDDTLVVCDEDNERLQKLTNAVAYSSQTGSAGTSAGQFSSNNGPYGIDRDASDNVYVTDRGNHRVTAVEFRSPRPRCLFRERIGACKERLGRYSIQLLSRPPPKLRRMGSAMCFLPTIIMAVLSN